MSTVDAIKDGLVTTGNFTLQAQLPMGKTITMSGYIYSESKVEEINKAVDLFHDVIDRQRIKAEIPELEAKLDQRHVQLQQLKDLAAQLNAKQEGGKKLSSAERTQADQIVTNIDRVLEDIEKGKLAILDAKATTK
jgi:hypothetical protein